MESKSLGDRVNSLSGIATTFATAVSGRSASTTCSAARALCVGIIFASAATRNISPIIFQRRLLRSSGKRRNSALLASRYAGAGTASATRRMTFLKSNGASARPT